MDPKPWIEVDDLLSRLARPIPKRLENFKAFNKKENVKRKEGTPEVAEAPIALISYISPEGHKRVKNLMVTPKNKNIRDHVIIPALEAKKRGGIMS
jgi:hypothetical protein